jgi:hypothetical protein
VTGASRSSWRMLALPPMAAKRLREMFEPLGVELSVPAVRDRDGLPAALADVNLMSSWHR